MTCDRLQQDRGKSTTASKEAYDTTIASVEADIKPTPTNNWFLSIHAITKTVREKQQINRGEMSLPPELSPSLAQSARLGMVNGVGVTFAHQPQYFHVDWQVGIDPEVDFALARSNLIEYKFELQVDE